MRFRVSEVAAQVLGSYPELMNAPRFCKCCTRASWVLTVFVVTVLFCMRASMGFDDGVQGVYGIRVLVQGSRV